VTAESGLGSSKEVHRMLLRPSLYSLAASALFCLDSPGTIQGTLRIQPN
jgi:hypothetical protein